MNNLKTILRTLHIKYLIFKIKYSLTVYQFEFLKTLLYGLSTGEQQPLRLSDGLCEELDNQFSYKLCYDVLKLVKYWPEHSGDFDCPVPSVFAALYPREWCCWVKVNHFNLWDVETDDSMVNKYNLSRRRMCRWLHDTIVLGRIVTREFTIDELTKLKDSGVDINVES